jgi:hypothetical protein
MSWKSILPSLESGGFDLLKMGASGLLGYFLGRRSKRGSICTSTYSGAVNLLNEYNVIFLQVSFRTASSWCGQQLSIGRLLSGFLQARTWLGAKRTNSSLGAACRKKRVSTITAKRKPALSTLSLEN